MFLPSKILILTFADAEYARIAALSVPNKRAYAETYGYPLRAETNLLNRTRTASWNKLDWVRRYLPEYEYVLWTDADTLIMNFEIRLEDLIAEGKGVDFIATEDSNGLNAGVFFLKNTKWARYFLSDVYAQSQFQGHIWGEQAAISYVLSEYGSASLKDFVAYLPARRMNAYPTNYVEGDFLIHFAGDGDRLKTMEGFL
jgi:mannan polymerase II complex MNN10 subunit